MTIKKGLWFWEVETEFEGQEPVKRRFMSDDLWVGSAPESVIPLPLEYPSCVFQIQRVAETEELKVIPKAESGVEIEIQGQWRPATEEPISSPVTLRSSGIIFRVRDLTNERRKPRFEPEKWAAQSEKREPGFHALWHFRDGVLVESVPLEDIGRPVDLLCGYRLHWSGAAPDRLQIIELDGIPQTLELESGRHGALRCVFEENIFVITEMPDRKAYSSLPVATVSSSGPNHMRQALLGMGATWLLLLSFFHLMPQGPAEPPKLEELPPELAKIILEAPKENSGGDGRQGGGGVETVDTRDPRGGSGVEAEKIAASSGPDEVVLTKGALGAIATAEKVLGSGVLKAIEATGAIASALGALDEGVRSGKVKAAGLGVRSGGAGGAQGVLGALNAMGGGGKAGGGVGIGGVGTQGFGGGGGGGKGSGFGTGIGSGLGRGQGARSVEFDSGSSTVAGGLERSEVEAVIRENISQIRFCYNRGLRNNPSLEGKVTSNFVIGSDGSVKTSRLAASSLGSGEVEDCIKDRVASWRFPQPRGGGQVQVNYPFLLKAN
jgi:hypothetical protein